jgi:predicted TIM-barrel fold metal-dependent hydrolase
MGFSTTSAGNHRKRAPRFSRNPKGVAARGRPLHACVAAPGSTPCPCAMERRRFLTRAAPLAAASVLGRAAPTPPPSPLVDTNVSLGDWPVRHPWAANAAGLAARLRRHGVTHAWAGAFDGVLHTDLASVNARLAADCATATTTGGVRFVPFGSVNPTLPDWEEDLRRCHEIHRMPGIRLHPGYQGYALADPRFARLLELTAQRGLLVQIALAVEDERTHHPSLGAGFVNVAPLPDLLPRLPAARVMLLNGTSRILAPANALLARLARAGVWLETATLEGVAGVSGLLGRLPDLRLSFGSHSPYFYFESALLKLQESALTPAQLTAVRHGHADRALARA